MTKRSKIKQISNGRSKLRKINHTDNNYRESDDELSMQYDSDGGYNKLEVDLDDEVEIDLDESDSDSDDSKSDSESESDISSESEISSESDEESDQENDSDGINKMSGGNQDTKLRKKILDLEAEITKIFNNKSIKIDYLLTTITKLFNNIKSLHRNENSDKKDTYNTNDYIIEKVNKVIETINSNYRTLITTGDSNYNREAIVMLSTLEKNINEVKNIEPVSGFGLDYKVMDFEQNKIKTISPIVEAEVVKIAAADAAAAASKTLSPPLSPPPLSPPLKTRAPPSKIGTLPTSKVGSNKTKNKTIYEEENDIISKDIEKYIPSRKLVIGENIADVLQKVSEGNNIKEIYEDRESNYFVRIFNYFVNKKFNDVYKDPTGANDFKQLTENEIMDTIIKPIQTEELSKVVFIKSSLPLFNRDNTINTFINQISVDKTIITDADKINLQNQYKKFITEMLNQDTTPQLKAFKNLYTIFQVQYNTADTSKQSPYLNMFYGRLLKTKASDFDALPSSGGGAKPADIYNLSNPVKKQKIKSKLNNSLDKSDKSAAKTTHWKQITNKYEAGKAQQATLYTINKKFTPTPKNYSMISPEVRNYLLECEDLQIFYINKHILIYDLMKKIILFIKYNKTMCEQIDKLTSPNEINDPNDPSSRLQLKSLIEDIKKLNDYDTQTMTVTEQIMKNKKVTTSTTLSPPLTGPVTLSGDPFVLTPDDNTKQLFITAKQLKTFGKEITGKDGNKKYVNGNTYYIDQGFGTQEEISKEKLFKDKVIDFYIKFGVALKNFRDYMLNPTTSNEITINDGNDVKGTIEVDYENERIKVTLSRPLIKEIDECTIIIPNFKKYIIKITGTQTFTNVKNNDTIYYKYKYPDPLNTEDHLLMTYTTDGTNNYFENINIEDPSNTNKYDLLSVIIEKCNADRTFDIPNAFNIVRYFVDNVASFKILEHIKEIQAENIASLSNILGPDDGTKTNKFKIDTLIKDYKNNIKNGAMIDVKTKEDALKTGESPRWTTFEAKSKPISQYFKNTIKKDKSREQKVTDIDHLQEVIYRCYDLQVLYMIKHLEVIYLNNILFYYMDMLSKQVAILLFVLALYKRYNFNIEEIGEHIVSNVLLNIGDIVKGQTEIMSGQKGVQAGGANPNPNANFDSGSDYEYQLNVDPNAQPDVLNSANDDYIKNLLKKHDPSLKLKAGAQPQAQLPPPQVGAPPQAQLPPPQVGAPPPPQPQLGNDTIQTITEYLNTHYDAGNIIKFTENINENVKIYNELVKKTESNNNKTKKTLITLQTPVVINDEANLLKFYNLIKTELDKTIVNAKDGDENKKSKVTIRKNNLEKISILRKIHASIADLHIAYKVDALNTLQSTTDEEKKAKDLAIEKIFDGLSTKRSLMGKYSKGINTFEIYGLDGILDLARQDDKLFSKQFLYSAKGVSLIQKKEDIKRKITTLKQDLKLGDKIGNSLEQFQKLLATNEEITIRKANCTDITCPPGEKEKLEAAIQAISSEKPKIVENLITNFLTEIQTRSSGIKLAGIEDFSIIKTIAENETGAELANLISTNIPLFMKDANEQADVTKKEQLVEQLKTLLENMKGGAASVAAPSVKLNDKSSAKEILKYLISYFEDILKVQMEKYKSVGANKLKDQEATLLKLETELNELLQKNPSLDPADKTKIDTYKGLLATDYKETTIDEIRKFIEDTRQSILQKAAAERKIQEELRGKKITIRDEFKKETNDNIFLKNITKIADSLSNQSKKTQIKKLFQTTLNINLDDKLLKEELTTINEIMGVFNTLNTPESFDNVRIELLNDNKTRFEKLFIKYKDIDEGFITQINDIINSLTRIDIEVIPLYNDLIKQLANCWNTINPIGGALDKDVNERINETAKSASFGITGEKLINAFKKSSDLFKEINALKKDQPINQALYDLYKNKINTLFTDPSLLTQDEIEKLTTNIRVIFEDILGAAMVIVRIKPLQPHNTAPTFQEIKDYIASPKNINKITADKFTVREYLNMKNREIKQAGGYNYGDIIKISEETGKIQIGDYCKGIIRNTAKEYGPFAGIYTPEYNNFDIYAYLFGTEKLLQPEGKNIQPPGNLSIVDNGILPYSNNTSQKLMSKLSKGGNVVLFGYGFSGSGKTYALLEGSKRDTSKSPLDDTEKYDPSLLEQFMKDNSELIHSIDFLDIYPLGIENPSDKTKRIRIFCSEQIDDNAKKLYGEGYYESNSLYDPILNPQSFGEIDKKIKQLEIFRRQNLRICATPNNDSSSRSFLQITINLKATTSKDDKIIKNKMIFFDMPGTENTVRIRTEFLGVETFEKVKNKKRSTNMKHISDKFKSTTDTMLDKAFKVYGEGTIEIFDFINKQKLDEAKQLYIEQKLENIEKVKNKQTPVTFDYITFFKSNLCTFLNLKKGLNLTSGTEEYISDISQEINLFLNGYTAKNIFDLTEEDFKPDIKTSEKKSLKIINDEIIKSICKTFITNVILRKKEWKLNEIAKGLDKVPGVYKYFTLKNSKEITPNDKIKPLITEEDYNNIERVFNIYFKTDDLTKLKFKTPDLALGNELFDFRKVLDGVVNPLNEKEKYIYIRNEENNNEVDHPLIRYFIVLMNILISNNLDTKNFYGILLILIYKYINFIVDQGSAIVTNLEHLKFFFLSNTNNVTKYNNNKKDDKEKYLCETADNCSNLLATKGREYQKSTKIGSTGISINETINMGSMEDFRLLSILQKLSNQQDNLSTLKTLTYKTTDKVPKDEYSLDLFSNKPLGSTQTQQKSSFVMFTNIKIFRDDSNKSKSEATDNIKLDEPDKTMKSKLTTNLDLLCNAESDTLDFAQSISSTTQTENSDDDSSLPPPSPPPEDAPEEPKPKPAASAAPRVAASTARAAAPRTSTASAPPRAATTTTPRAFGSSIGRPKGGGSISNTTNTSATLTKSPKKFNMKELTKKHKKQNRIITIKKQEKKKNNKKSLFVRRSKKYQD